MDVLSGGLVIVTEAAADFDTADAQSARTTPQATDNTDGADNTDHNCTHLLAGSGW